MAAPLLTLRDIHHSFGGEALLEGAELFVHERDRVCVVGRNGSGKSTLLKIAAGHMAPDEGERFLQPGATVRYLEQEPDFSNHVSVQDFVDSGLAPGDDAHYARALLDRLGVDGAQHPASLSGGEARRAALVRALAPQPDVLFLDEPTNHLDLPGIDWLERELGGTRCALVIISHDRRFLKTLTRRTVWLDRGACRTLDAGFAEFEAWRDAVLEEEARDRHKLDRKIVAEEHWLRYGVTARRKRNQKRLADLHALRKTRRETRGPVGTAKMAAAESAGSGKRVIDAEVISKAYDGRLIVADFSIRIARGDRIGVAGPNGAGKTTLLNLLTGIAAPDAGRVTLGTKLEMVTLDQQRAGLKSDVSLMDTLTPDGGDMVNVGGKPRHVRSYMKDFLFAAEQAGSPVGSLSGGERGRLALAIALARPSNLLVLDEPTNDLDLETLDLLEELLADYAGTVLLVSHDRDFLDRIVTSLIASDPACGEGGWREYAGGYSDMERQRAPARDKPSAKPEKARQKAAGKGGGAGRAKLTYKDKHALETLPGRMDKMRACIAKLQSELADPALFANNPERFSASADALSAAQAALAAAEEEWLTLEMRREELEG